MIIEKRFPKFSEIKIPLTGWESISFLATVDLCLQMTRNARIKLDIHKWDSKNYVWHTYICIETLAKIKYCCIITFKTVLRTERYFRIFSERDPSAHVLPISHSIAKILMDGLCLKITWSQYLQGKMWSINRCYFLLISIQLLLSSQPSYNNSLRWRHNERGSVSNHQPHDCLLNGLFGRRSKKTWKLRVTGLCAGNSPGTGEFPAHMASNAENVSIWWRHHVQVWFYDPIKCMSQYRQSILDVWNIQVKVQVYVQIYECMCH